MLGKRHKWTRRSVSSRRSSGARERHRTEVSAGGLIFTRRRGQVFFAMVVDSYGKWAFPKGHVRDGEQYRAAAIREIGEEMGLFTLRFVARLDTIDIWFRDRYVHKGELIHKYIHYFLFEAPPDAELVKPPPSEDGEQIQSVAWVPAHELAERSSYPDMVSIIEKALRICKSSSWKTSKPTDGRAKSWRSRKATRGISSFRPTSGSKPPQRP